MKVRVNKETSNSPCSRYLSEEERIKKCMCECEEPIKGNTYYECNYGNCCGYKCQKCDGFV